MSQRVVERAVGKLVTDEGFRLAMLATGAQRIEQVVWTPVVDL